MDKPEWTRTKGFRLPQRTLDQFDYLVEKGAGRNATEIVIIATEKLATEYRLKEDILTPTELIGLLISQNSDTETNPAKSSAGMLGAAFSKEAFLKSLRGKCSDDSLKPFKNMSETELKEFLINMSKRITLTSSDDENK
jgi:hypothetical protein